MSRFANHPRLREVARGLGLCDEGNCRERLVRYAVTRAADVLREHPVDSLAGFRTLLAAHLSVAVERVGSDGDLGSIAERYRFFGFPVLRLLQREFNQLGSEGILLARPNPAPGERSYLAVIDARGEQAWRFYFTVWHELAHLLLRPALRPGTGMAGIVRRIPAAPVRGRDPLESVVDEIAGLLAFHEPLFRPALEAELAGKERVSFSVIARVRAICAPEASLYATAIASIRFIQKPVCLIRARKYFSARDGDQARRSGPPLRVDQVIWSEAARGSPLRIYPKIRVPEDSALRAVYGTMAPDETCAIENQSNWATRTSGALPNLPIHITALSRGLMVYGLIAPL